MKTVLSSSHELSFEVCEVDLFQLESNLQLTFEERLVKHQKSLDLILELREKMPNETRSDQTH